MPEGQETFPPTRSGKIEEVVPFGKERLLVLETNVDLLRRDLILEAQAQEVSLKDAQALAKRVRFSTEVPVKTPEDKKTIGAIHKNKDGSIDCHLDIAKIAKSIDKHVPEEGVVVALKEAIEETWRHERQHLIQQARPVPKRSGLEAEKKESSERSFRIAKFVLVGSSGLASVSICASKPEIGLVIGCIGGYLALRKAIQTADEYYKNSPEEIEGRIHSRMDMHSGRQSPFSLNVEKQSKF